MTETASTRTALDDSMTHVLQFGPFCGATLLDRVRGLGLWVLMTADDYHAGRIGAGPRDWAWEARKGTPPGELAAWVAPKVGYPVTVTRADDLADPDWAGSIAYAVRRAAR